MPKCQNFGSLHPDTEAFCHNLSTSTATKTSWKLNVTQFEKHNQENLEKRNDARKKIRKSWAKISPCLRMGMQSGKNPAKRGEHCKKWSSPRSTSLFDALLVHASEFDGLFARRMSGTSTKRSTRGCRGDSICYVHVKRWAHIDQSHRYRNQQMSPMHNLATVARKCVFEEKLADRPQATGFGTSGAKQIMRPPSVLYTGDSYAYTLVSTYKYKNRPQQAGGNKHVQENLDSYAYTLVSTYKYKNRSQQAGENKTRPRKLVKLATPRQQGHTDERQESYSTSSSEKNIN